LRWHVIPHLWGGTHSEVCEKKKRRRGPGEIRDQQGEGGKGESPFVSQIGGGRVSREYAGRERGKKKKAVRDVLLLAFRRGKKRGKTHAHLSVGGGERLFSSSARRKKEMNKKQNREYQPTFSERGKKGEKKGSLLVKILEPGEETKDGVNVDVEKRRKKKRGEKRTGDRKIRPYSIKVREKGGKKKGGETVLYQKGAHRGIHLHKKGKGGEEGEGGQLGISSALRGKEVKERERRKREKSLFL